MRKKHILLLAIAVVSVAMIPAATRLVVRLAVSSYLSAPLRSAPDSPIFQLTTVEEPKEDSKNLKNEEVGFDPDLAAQDWD